MPSLDDDRSRHSSCASRSFFVACALSSSVRSVGMIAIVRCFSSQEDGRWSSIVVHSCLVACSSSLVHCHHSFARCEGSRSSVVSRRRSTIVRRRLGVVIIRLLVVDDCDRSSLLVARRRSFVSTRRVLVARSSSLARCHRPIARWQRLRSFIACCRWMMIDRHHSSCGSHSFVVASPLSFAR